MESRAAMGIRHKVGPATCKQGLGVELTKTKAKLKLFPASARVVRMAKQFGGTVL